MASVSGMSSSNMSSLYGSRNVLSGLASGMDTESMIENSISGIRLKLTGIQQKQTKLQWKQEAYQTISDKLVQFSRKYTSYTSSTNLLSPSFFNKAVLTSTGGANASKVSATGRSNSSVQVNGVAQLATASRYQVSSGGILRTGDMLSIEASSTTPIDLAGQTTSSTLTGGMVIEYGTQSVSLDFQQSDALATTDEFLSTIRSKLAQQKLTLSSGTTGQADEFIDVTLVDGKITFSDKKAAGNTVSIDGVTGKLAETFKDTNFSDANNRVSTLDLTGKPLTTSISVMEQLGGKTMSFTLDGMTKQITLPTQQELTDKGGAIDNAFTSLLSDKLTAAFGAGKVVVSDKNAADNDLRLSFTVSKGSSLSIVGTEVNATLGLDQAATSYLNTSKTLGDLLGETLGNLIPADAQPLKGIGATTTLADGTYCDQKGNVVDKDGNRLGKDGKLLYGADLTINGQVIGTYHRDSTLENVMLGINNSTTAGVSLSYSKVTNQFVFTAKDTGAGHSISYQGGGLAEKLFGAFDADPAKYTEGKDAIVNMTVNGNTLTVSRSSNTFDVDGMSVTVKETFNHLDASGNPVLDGNGKPTVVANPKDPVTFTSNADADKIVNAIKEMVKDYNTIVTDVRTAFNTIPAQKSNGKKYEPLTEKDKESMTESSIKAYEDKAKQGLLFGDQDLSAMYTKLISAISPSGTDATTLRSIGLSTDYSQGLTTLNLDETKLREMLSTNPETVRDAFTKVAGEGSSSDGLMKKLKSTLDTYSSVEGTKGILINKAGSKYSAVSLLNNSMKDQMDTLEKQADKVQDTLSTKVDYYTRQFTRLEQLISQMNAQSSSIFGMSGG